MGYYLEPQMDKKAYLQREARPIKRSEVLDVFAGEDEVPVALIDNGMFLAAGILFDEGEATYFLEDSSGRPISFWAISKEKARWNAPGYDAWLTRKA